MAEEQANEANNEENKQQFIIQKVYSKDISFETPNSPKIRCFSFKNCIVFRII